MQRQPVTSTNMRSVGYDASTQTLEVEFGDGAVYEYYDVPPAVHVGLMQATSQGSYLHRYIRDRYAYRRVS